MDTLGPDNAFWIDGEWLSWADIPSEEGEEFSKSHLAKLEHDANLRLQYPHADITLIPIFRDLLELAERYHIETGLHLQVYGDIGELFGAITYGIKLHRNYATGSDGRIGNDFVEIKTITPFKKINTTMVRLDRHFNKILVVKINEEFHVSGRMMLRRSLTKNHSGTLKLRWNDLNDV